MVKIKIITTTYLKNNIIKVYFTRTNETQHGHIGTQCER